VPVGLSVSKLSLPHANVPNPPEGGTADGDDEYETDHRNMPLLGCDQRREQCTSDRCKGEHDVDGITAVVVS
jgi:hypothetical protein